MFFSCFIRHLQDNDLSIFTGGLIIQSNPTIHLISLGCARNKVDSEVMLGSLISKGWSVTDDDANANVVLINTCGFIGSAKEESIQTILEAAEHKKNNPTQKLVVAGCLTQRYKSQLLKGLPEVDLFIGTDMFPELPSLLEKKILDDDGKMFAKRTNYLYDGELPRLNTLNPFSAYVKVAEGCQHNCAFCIIPAIRGPLRSRPKHRVFSEVQTLVDQGVKEINLIAQDLAAYGRDRDNSDNVYELLQDLETIEDLKWIRLLYYYPENIEPRILRQMAESKKIVPYLDVPMQSGSTELLKLMKRDVTREQLIQRVAMLRDYIPNIAIRTSVMVGFPGETEAHFKELLDFVQECQFDHLGCFTYSKEEGTVAYRYPNHIDQDVMDDRQRQVMELQRSISRKKLEAYVGTTQQALILGPSEESELLLEARLATQAPEVDGVVLINRGNAKVGKIQKIRITESHDYDLIATALDDDESIEPNNKKETFSQQEIRP